MKRRKYLTVIGIGHAAFLPVAAFQSPNVMCATASLERADSAEASCQTLCGNILRRSFLPFSHGPETSISVVLDNTRTV